MKVTPSTDMRSSFGVPPHMQPQLEAMQKAMKEVSQDQPPSSPETVRPSKAFASEESRQPAFSEDFTPQEMSQEPESLKSMEISEDPVKLLKDRYDIELTSDDIQRIIFKGYTEKEVVVVPSILGSEPLIATFKTLTGKEYEEADERLAEEIRDSRMTNDGFAARRGLWLLAYGLRKIQGKVYYKQMFMDEAKKILDRKATLESRKRALGDFSPMVLSKMMEIQSNITVAINYLFTTTKGDSVKKP